MKHSQWLSIGLLVSALDLRLAAIEPGGDEFQSRDTWLRRYAASGSSRLPFSFDSAGRPAGELAAQWRKRVVVKSDPSNASVRQHELTWVDLRSHLEVRCDLLEFCDHPAVEWVVYLRNRGTNDSPTLSDIRAVDLEVDLLRQSQARLRYARGAVCSLDDFEPLTEALTPGRTLHLEPTGGRSSSDYLPFFNLATSDQDGVVVGLGWSGEWAADFTQTSASRTRLQAGQAHTSLKLHPGEEIRTPRVALVFYEGDWVRGQNLWRRFILQAHRPKVNGQPLTPPLFNGNWGGTSAASHLANIRAIIEHQLPVEFYWIDAEWFGQGPWWMNPGNWRVKKDLYPDGFKPISDALHASGRKLLLWFEPERVCAGTPWAGELRPWLLTVPPERRFYNWGDKHSFTNWVKSESHRNQINEDDQLFNLAIPEAQRFLTDFISARITEFGLDCYRHDANIAPLEFWRAADAPERQGMTEIRWVEGLYAFWDGLLQRHPGLLIDNCASGGRRIDLETMSRSTPFWRTDFPGNPIGRQCHTYGISFWVPLNSTGAVTPGRDSDYAWRSTFSSAVTFGLFGNGDAPQAQAPSAQFPFDQARRALEQYRAVQPYFLGDYYPLTPYTQSEGDWLGWQFHREDRGGGLIQAFRRPKAGAASIVLKLYGLKPQARYQVSNLDTQVDRLLSGRELMDQGLLVSLPAQPGAALLTYVIAH